MIDITVIKNYTRKKRGAAREYCDGHVTSVIIDIIVIKNYTRKIVEQRVNIVTVT
jgi:hypothetical protein